MAAVENPVSDLWEDVFMNVYVVEKEAVIHNIQTILKKAENTPVWAVLKGDGYGLGIVPMAELCWQQGIRRFAVTELREAQVLREKYRDAHILMLRPTMDEQDMEQLLDLEVIATIASTEHAAALGGIASRRDTVAEVHVKVDTGMGRYGFLPGESQQILDIYRYHDHLAVSGIYTNFHSSFGKAKIVTAQADTFGAVVKQIHAAGIESGAPHCCNSVGFLRFPELKMGGVRVGSALLGRVLAKKTDLRRVGYCETTVEQVRWLPAGHTTGYGAAWKAKKPTKIAVIPVGWYHGFTAEHGHDLSGFKNSLREILGAIKGMIFRRKIYVNIGGKKCRVLGHVGMLHTVCDVTKIDCHTGDKAVLDINPTMVRGMEVVYR